MKQHLTDAFRRDEFGTILEAESTPQSVTNNPMKRRIRDAGIVHHASTLHKGYDWKGILIETALLLAGMIIFFFVFGWGG